MNFLMLSWTIVWCVTLKTHESSSGRGGQLTVQQQVRRFQERAPLSQLLDRITAVPQDPLVAGRYS